MANLLYALYLTSCLLANFEYGGLGDLLSRTEANRSLHFFYGNERQLHTVRNERDEFYRFTRDGNRAVIKEQGEVGLVPFLYQGQYLDTETGLAYNRFRYYSPETGAYISQDPIRLEAGLTNLYAYVHDVNAWVDPLGLAKVFRSMSRAEYFDIKHNGWNSYGQMESKWFANSYDDAVTFGHRLGHGTDTKFYVVGFEIDDEILSGAYKVKNLDAIGDALAIDIDQLNNSSPIVTSINSQRVEIDSH